jgi:hypothetical protein
MSSTKDWLKKGHTPLYIQSGITKKFLDDANNRTRIGFLSGSPQGIWLEEEFFVKLAVFVAAYLAWMESESERTPHQLTALLAAEKAFRKVYRKLYTGFLKENPLVTDNDLEDMALPKHHAGGITPAPVATTVPWVKVRLRVVRHLTFDFGGSETSKAKPDGQHGMEMTGRAGGDKPSGLGDLTHSYFDTHTPLDIEFREDERGQTFWFAVRWENTTGEKGPWSEIMSAVIP